MEIGQIFGYWRVKEKYHRGSTKCVKAQCTCGDIHNLVETPGKRGHPESCRRCGVRRESGFRSGQKYGDWTLLLPRVYKHSCSKYWDAICKCGTIKMLRASSLASGKSLRCNGCEHLVTGHEKVKSRMWTVTTRGAKLRGIEVTADKDEAFRLLEKQGFKCALSGCDLYLSDTLQKQRSGKTTASLDRIDSDKGYTIDNLQWVHKKINIIKMDLDQEEFIRLCHQVAKHNPRDV